MPADATNPQNRAELPAHLSVLERGWLSSNNIVFADDEVPTVVDTGYVTHADATLALLQQALRLEGVGDGVHPALPAPAQLRHRSLCRTARSCRPVRRTQPFCGLAWPRHLLWRPEVSHRNGGHSGPRRTRGGTAGAHDGRRTTSGIAHTRC